VKVTLDLNVLLDVFQKREPHYAASAQVVSMVTAGTVAGVCPAHGLTTLYYLVRKHASKPDAEAAMDQVLRHFQIGNLEAADWQEARRLPFADFEDAVVATVASLRPRILRPANPLPRRAVSLPATSSADNPVGTARGCSLVSG
jgi:predicted nucleic acid-binding protein